MEPCGIYLITNLVNNKKYVGQSRFMWQRWRKHKSEANNNNPLPLYCAIRKYGIDNFKFEILEECAPDQLNDRESYYIFNYNSFVPNGYNIRVPAEEGYYANVPDNIIAIIQDLQEGILSYDELANKYGFTKSHIQSINYGQSWRLLDMQYPINKFHNGWDTTQVVPLLQSGLKTWQVAKKLQTTQSAVESYMQKMTIHTSDFRKRLTSNRTLIKKDLQGNILKSYPSIKEGAQELSEELNIEFNTALCGIKRNLKKGNPYKNYKWEYGSE